VLKSAIGPYPAGTPYSAHDPELLLWVHATLSDSVIRAYEDLVQPLAGPACDDYLASAALGMTRIGLPLGRAPQCLGDLRVYLTETMARGMLAITPASRELADAVLGSGAGWMLLPFFRLQRLLAIGSLPTTIREMYGYEWSARSDRRLASVRAAIRAARASAPDRLARWSAARGSLRPTQ
jgi:uncharacterized protein (DUF2236 family)